MIEFYERQIEREINKLSRSIPMYWNYYYLGNINSLKILLGLERDK
ncbi:hypothetical protein mgb1_012 [Bacillus phage MG-B1]|uniref:Uncharacterized protein n=1 Tax=Bacillus phage MG-B1 TaxID=1309583 RepID=M4WNI2_9CAUD|nr:hypothetical protein mgb1_012 [Bacillus phage MG-B1]AGI10601.1 hypothetical protein mgb1_012 [Bacillus phage MG-B1]